MSGYEARCRDIREGLLRYFIDCDTRPGQGWGWGPDAAVCDIPREMYQQQRQLCTSAANRSIGSTIGCTITEKVESAFKTLSRHFARSVDMKLNPRRNYHEGWAANC